MRDRWIDLGPVEKLKRHPLQHIIVEKTPLALVYTHGEFRAVSGTCNHAKGPLGKGRMDGDYVVCPWHGWHFHRITGHAPAPFEAARLPRYRVKEQGGHLFVNMRALNPRTNFPHPVHPLSRKVVRQEGPIRVAGISTTAMDTGVRPRYSTSEDLLETALRHAGKKFRVETRLIKLRDLHFQHCGGFYSVDEKACTWPCTYTQMDEKDQLSEVYEALVFWADVVLVATPIRWGSASSLYYKMVERLNCVENQLLVADTKLIRNKVAAFIITGGQDNVQAVAGQMMMFFGQLGFVFPQDPFVGHSRGWSAEDMENNTIRVRSDKELHKSTRGLVERSIDAARMLLKK